MGCVGRDPRTAWGMYALLEIVRFLPMFLTDLSLRGISLEQCFPKSGPRTIFGPLEFFLGPREKKPYCYAKTLQKSVLKSIILGHFIYKTVRNPKKI